MDADIRTLAEQILLEGEQGLTDRERRVLARIAKRRAISRNATQAYEEGQTLGSGWPTRSPPSAGPGASSSASACSCWPGPA
ncbi:hypothetical protein [Aerophototrophica crusticola]|uniref:hypothetical protein n=1 Tax=Aerophototrophica crusticola TaxID=1709002 RepID=UPI00384EECCA